MVLVLVVVARALGLLWFSKGEVTVSHVPAFGFHLSRFAALLVRAGSAQTWWDIAGGEGEESTLQIGRTGYDDEDEEIQVQPE